MGTKSGVYIITNTESSKVYIGSTVDFKRRWGQHKRDLRRGGHNNPHLQAAWVLYGEDAFEFGVLEYLDDPEGLHLAEQFWVSVYCEEHKDLYNIGTPGKAPMLGRSHTEETRRKIGEALMGSQHCLGRKLTREHKRRTSEALMGHSVSEETRRKMGKAARGRRPSDEHRRKLSEANKGKKPPPFSDEHCRKIGEARAGPYPAFIHRETGEAIPAGVNLCALCRERGLSQGNMHAVKTGRRKHCKGWMLGEAK